MATPVLMPRQGQSVESCVLVEWLVKPGDVVQEGAPLANIETDKAVFEVESPAAGTVLELFFDEGDDIPVLTHMAAIGEAGEDVAGLRPGEGGAPAPVAPSEPADAGAGNAVAPVGDTEPAAGSGGGTAVGVSPRARHTAARLGVRTQGLQGSGPGGRIIERDVEAASASTARLSPAAREAAAGGASVPSAGRGPGGMILAADVGAADAAPAAAAAPAPLEAAQEVIKVQGIRKLIAERMHASLSGTAQLTLHRSFDATGLQAYRAKVKASAETLGLPNITLNDMLAYAVARTLVRHPALNAHWLGDRIVRFGSVNLGVAADTPRGLMVPVLRGAERLSLSAMSQAIKPMVKECQAGNINPDLLSGGTFTITNMGMLGIESFTPILNVPEVAILGVGGLFLKAVQRGGSVEHVPAINLSLTLDHQAVDGADGARFLKDLAESLEAFELCLAS